MNSDAPRKRRKRCVTRRKREWIKIADFMPNRREIFAISDALGLSRLETVGLCVMFWCWANQHAHDGILRPVEKRTIDSIIGHGGLADALESVGWIAFGDRVAYLPKSDIHGARDYRVSRSCSGSEQ
jgi:hypothetical protein